MTEDLDWPPKRVVGRRKRGRHAAGLELALGQRRAREAARIEEAATPRPAADAVLVEAVPEGRRARHLLPIGVVRPSAPAPPVDEVDARSDYRRRSVVGDRRAVAAGARRCPRGRGEDSRRQRGLEVVIVAGRQRPLDPARRENGRRRFDGPMGQRHRHGPDRRVAARPGPDVGRGQDGVARHLCRGRAAGRRRGRRFGRRRHGVVAPSRTSKTDDEYTRHQQIPVHAASFLQSLDASGNARSSGACGP